MSAIFFDIDGTLLNWKKQMPESTKKALAMLRANGHRTFICTGRTKVFTLKEPALRSGFDGMLCGCGTNIILNGEELFYEEVPMADMQRAIDILTDVDMPFILEGRDYFYSRSEELKQERYGHYIIESMGDELLDADAHREDIHASKLLGIVLEAHRDTFPKDLEYIRQNLPQFNVMNHNNRALEIVPAGFSKATAILKLCRITGMDPTDTFAVGDGNNDIEMLDLAGHGIAMGNANDNAKKHADYVTTDVNEDGIFNAMKHFSLI